MKQTKKIEKLMAGYAASKCIFEGWTRYVALACAFGMLLFSGVEALKYIVSGLGFVDVSVDKEMLFSGFAGWAILMIYQNYKLQKHIIESRQSHDM